MTSITRSLPELVNCLADADEGTARGAVRELMGAIPMAALPERWTDNSEYLPPVQSVVPDWLIEAGTEWHSSNEFINTCAELAGQLEGTQLDLFFTRMAALLGATRLFTAALRERGQETLATRFILRLTHTRMRQFPMQICFSPTLRCQLDCPYCISAGTAKETTPEPDRSRVDTLLDWLARQGIRRIGLSGGEPTLSPLFPYIADETKLRGMSLYMASNAMFSPSICSLIIDRGVSSITLHLTDQTIEDSAKKKVFIRNARALAAAGINAALRCNLTRLDQDPAIYADYAHETGIREVRVAVPTPNAQHGNEYIEPETLENFARQLVALHARCESYAIPLHLAKPFPLCLLPERTARYFLANGSAAINCPMHQNDYSNNIVVHPDFSFIPCLGLSMKQHRPIVEHDNIRQAARTFSDFILPLIREPLFRHCPECPLWKGSRCLGACLSYRLPSTPGDDYPKPDSTDL